MNAPPVTPGVYRHYKKGDLYRVLSVAEYTGSFFHGESPNGLESGPRYGLPEGTKLVVYIGLYDNPHGNRECARPEREWNEWLVDVPLNTETFNCYTGFRYTRIGD